MEVRLALLADGANVSREGKLNVLGVFDTIYARTFPVAHPQMQLVLRFVGAPGDGRSRQLEVRFEAEDGQVLFALPGAISARPVVATDPVTIDHVIAVNNLSFEAPGRYAFRIVLDGNVVASVSLRVQQIPVGH